MLTTQYVLVGIASVIFALSSYRAYRIWRLLVSRVHRSQAWWACAFSLLFIPFELSAMQSYSVGPLSPVQFGLVYSFIIAFNFVSYVYLDRTIMVAREMDFFHRDSLGYARARGFVWSVSALGMFGTILLPQAGLLTAAFHVLWPAPLGYYSIALALSSARVLDRAMRNYAKWFGLAVAVIVLAFLFTNFNPTDSLLLVAGFAVSSICFYGATASLSPTSKLERELGPSGLEPPRAV